MQDSKIPTIEEMAQKIFTVATKDGIIPDYTFYSKKRKDVEDELRILYDALAEKDALIAEARTMIECVLWFGLVPYIEASMDEWLEKTKGVEQ